MRFSIITAVFNREHVIEQNLSSLNQQLDVEVEHIIVDNCSSDATMSIVENNDTRHDRIIISEPDDGIYDAINKGLRAATGDIVGFLHSDDAFTSPFLLKKVQHEFIKRKNCDALYGDVAYLALADNDRIGRYYSSKKIGRKHLKYGVAPAHPSLFMKRSVLSNVGYYNTDYRIAGDFEYFCRLFNDQSIVMGYYEYASTFMLPTGASRPTLKTFLEVSKEIRTACKINGIHSNMLLSSMRFIIKLGQLLDPKTCKPKGTILE